MFGMSILWMWIDESQAIRKIAERNRIGGVQPSRRFLTTRLSFDVLSSAVALPLFGFAMR